MPIAYNLLDTVFPPTWDGTSPVPLGDEVLDASSALRTTAGDDWQNYFTSQRAEGDLFKRDVLLSMGLKQVVDYLATRAGLLFNFPSAFVAPNTEAWINTPGIANFSSYYLVALGATIQAGLASANTGVRAINTNTSIEIDSCTTQTGVKFLAANITDRGPAVSFPIQIKAFNDSADDVVFSSWALVVPKTYA